jgi:hypothetical protein
MGKLFFYEPLAHLVYLDAIYPRDGQSAYDVVDAASQATADAEIQTYGDGWRRPPPKEDVFRTRMPDDALRTWFVSRLTFQPSKVGRQPLRRTNPLAAALPHTHIACIEGWSEEERAELRTRIAQEPHGQYREVDTHHLGLVTAPQDITQALLAVVAA